ncbi:hypothetical protein SRHO_G00327550 [Serrasalmus rhombeus]
MINGKRVTDKTRTICKHCMKTMPYTAANTSTMQRHLQHHHSTVLKSTTAPVKKTSQTTLTNTFGPQLPQSSVRATAITRDTGVFIAADMRPFSVVENQGFRRLLHTLEPKYTIPPRTHFTRTVISNLYEESKNKIVQILKDAASIAITTDGWTSRSTQSYITITAHTINSDWKMESVVLQTRPLFESHTGANIAEVLQTAVTDWELKKPNHGIAIVTDNARNMDVAVREAGLKPHIKCFAHIINLATQAGLGVPRVARLLGRTATTVLCEEKSPTVSLIVPLKSMIEQSMTPNDGDSTTVANTKTAILTNIANRYSGDAFNYLVECTVLDPRFRTQCKDQDQCKAVFLRVQNKAEQLLQKQTTAEEREEGAAGGAHCPTHSREETVRDDEPEVIGPVPKKTALEDLLGNSFSTEPEGSNSSKQAEREVENYRKEASIPLSGCPLKWWQEHCSRYPLLSQLAKACLSVPATSVPSERIFSTAGDVVNAQRSQLLPENVDMLIFLKKNMAV